MQIAEATAPYGDLSSIASMEERIRMLEKEMKTAAKEQRFEKAAELRDRIRDLKTGDGILEN